MSRGLMLRCMSARELSEWTAIALIEQEQEQDKALAQRAEELRKKGVK